MSQVDGWTHFSKTFTHLYTGQLAPDRAGLLTAVLTDATNLGKTRMADATEKYTADRLAWIEDWYVRCGTQGYWKSSHRTQGYAGPGGKPL
jgi:hypothetical protein